MPDLKSIHIVLYQPEIPQNTGNIARTCAAAGACLHLIKPLGFSTEDRYLKRAGLDYWNLVDVFEYEDFREFKSKNPQGNFAYLTKRPQSPTTGLISEATCFLYSGVKRKDCLKKSLLRTKRDASESL